MENKKETVCAVVVTYNRKELLLECLEALRKQTRPVQGIYLIDNASTDGTPKLLLEKGYIKKLPPENLTEPWEKEFEIKNLTDGEVIKLHYVRMHENTGGAGGFHEGVKRGYEKGYDWLWLMDDDVSPERNCLETLLKESEKRKDILVISPVKIMPQGIVTGATLNYDLSNPFFRKVKYLRINKEDLMNLPEYLEVHDVPFEGALIRRKAIQLVGYPMESLFINFDDLEFFIRIRKCGKIGLCRDALIRKNPMNYSQNMKALKEYYAYRNLTLIDRIHGNNPFVRHLRPLLYFVRAILKRIITLRFKNLWLILIAFYDGYFLTLDRKILQNRFGRLLD